ncbi:MAG TPA: hypothetical protein VF212_10805 [Longimicrobiales bacterium]
MARYGRGRDEAWARRSERESGGAERERPAYVRGIERTERPRSAAGPLRRRLERPPGPPHRGRPGRRRREAGYDREAAPPGEGAFPGPRAARHRRPSVPARYAEEYERWGAGRYGPEYGEYGRGYRGAGGARRGRSWVWRRRATVPAREVPEGRRDRERWWHAIGPERREDYDWAFGGLRPARYGWTGETGRDGGPGSRRRGRRRRRR